MLEHIINTPLSTVVVNPGSGSLTDAVLYFNNAVSAQAVTVAQIGSTPVWSVTFTPNATGNWTLIAFGVAQFWIKVVNKSLYEYLKNVEDEAMGSWTWNKETKVLTMLRQDSTTLATFNVEDTLTDSSRERI